MGRQSDILDALEGVSSGHQYLDGPLNARRRGLRATSCVRSGATHKSRQLDQDDVARSLRQRKPPDSLYVEGGWYRSGRPGLQTDLLSLITTGEHALLTR